MSRRGDDEQIQVMYDQDLYRLLIESTTEYAIFHVTLQGVVATWNVGAERLEGWTAKEIIGRNRSMFYGPEDVASGKPERDLEVAASEGVLRDEGWRIRKDGSRYWASIVISALRDNQGRLRAFAVILRDLSEQKRTEDNLRHERMLLDSIIDNIPDMLFMKDAVELRFARFNKAGEELIGIDRTQMIGKNDYDFFPVEQADFFTKNDRAVLAGDGVLDIPEEPIATRSKGTRILHTKKIPLRDSAGKPQFLLGISEDVTERVQAEIRIRSLNAELLTRTRELTAANKELDAFSSSVAHDLRAPLRSIDGFSQALLEDCAGQLDDTGKQYLRSVRTSAQQMAQLIEDLLALSRVTRSELAREPIDLAELARTILERFAKAHPDRTVEIVVPAHIPAVADRRLMGIVLENLLGNAWKFTSRTANARIEVGMTAANDETIYFVRDNGAGFDMAFADRLFGIFQRLHSPMEFEGTGIGLATVRRIVQRHGGRIWADAKVDGGATFNFTLVEAA